MVEKHGDYSTHDTTLNSPVQLCSIWLLNVDGRGTVQRVGMGRRRGGAASWGRRPITIASCFTCCWVRPLNRKWEPRNRARMPVSTATDSFSLQKITWQLLYFTAASPRVQAIYCLTYDRTSAMKSSNGDWKHFRLICQLYQPRMAYLVIMSWS